MTQKKPTNQDEIQADIAAHPERGMLNGEDVVRFEPIAIQINLPRELENQLLEIGACLGMSKSEVLRFAIASFVTLPGNQAMVDRWQEKKAEKFSKGKAVIREKVFGCYKKIARAKRARMDKGISEASTP